MTAPTKKRPHKFVASHVNPAAIDRTPLRVHAWEPLPGSNPLPLDEHQPGLCRWPVGERNQPCCLPTGEHHNYCPEHLKLAFRPYAPPRPPRQGL